MVQRRSPRRRCSACFNGIDGNDGGNDDDGGNGHDDVRSKRRDINDDDGLYEYETLAIDR